MMLSRYHNFFANDRFLIGTSLLRIVIGMLLLYHYLIHYHQRYFLYSNRGINEYDNTFISSTISLYNFNSSLLYFDIIYHLSIIITFIYLLGYYGRLFSILNYVFYYSLYVRMFQISDGGDNILIICMFFLIFANCTTYFSLDADRLFKKKRNSKRWFTQIQTIIHNFAVLFCIIQLCLLYLFSGMYQLMGELWQNGTSMYYISQVREFSRPLFRYLTEHHLFLMIILSYASILLKFAFPFTIMNKKAKPFVVSTMILFHLGIGLSMGLISFSGIMISLELLVFTDQEYQNIYQRLKMTLKKQIIIVKRIFRNWGYSHLQPFRIVVFFDGWCPVCKVTKQKLNRLDYFRQITWINFRDTNLLATYGLVNTDVEKRMHSTQRNRKNKMKNGINSFIQITTRIPLMWIFVPILLLAKLVGIGEAVYDYFASNRKVLPVNQCTDIVCDLSEKR